MTEKDYYGERNLGNYAEKEMGKGGKLFPTFDDVLKAEPMDVKPMVELDHTTQKPKPLKIVGLGESGLVKKHIKHPVLGTNK